MNTVVNCTESFAVLSAGHFPLRKELKGKTWKYLNIDHILAHLLVSPLPTKNIQFWDAVDSFSGLSYGFCYIFTVESTSKVDKFHNLHYIDENPCLIQKRVLGIRTKRPEQEENLQTKKGCN